jgi:hypothetical protein
MHTYDLDDEPRHAMGFNQAVEAVSAKAWNHAQSHVQSNRRGPPHQIGPRIFLLCARNEKIVFSGSPVMTEMMILVMSLNGAELFLRNSISCPR